MAKETSLRKLIDSTVGPAPWYWSTFPPFDVGGRQLRWRFLGTKGKCAHLVVLEEKGGGSQPLLALNTYARPFPANSGYLGIWYPMESQNVLEIVIFELAGLRSIKGFSDQLPDFKNSSVPLLHSSPMSEHLRIPDRLPAGPHKGPKARHAYQLKELLLLARGPTVFEDDLSAAVSIYDWRPATGDVEVLPQEWFTAKDYDLGYQWITRVTRHPESSHIIGGGIRIGDFELADSGKNLLRWLS